MLTPEELNELNSLEFRAYTDLPFGPAENTRMMYLQSKRFYGDGPQSRMDSIIEASINILIGFLISWAVWPLILNPLFHYHAGLGESFLVTCIYTVISFFRQFLIRRWLNGKIIWEGWLQRGHNV